MKTHNGILMRRSSIKYFRGVNFHVSVLQSAGEILKMLPSFVESGELKQLKTMDDSIRLGQLMIIYRNINQLKKDP